MKAVIPAAGMGTRFLPFTKNAPKEMLPLVDKPAIQYVVEEAVQSGCDDIVIITGRGKHVIEDHFDLHPELEAHLARQENAEALESIRRISSMADIHYIRQKEPLGLGHAIYQARRHIGEEPFAVLLGDDIVFSQEACTKQLMRHHEATSAPIIAVEPIAPEKSTSYGVVDIEDGAAGLHRIRTLVEKPAPEDAPSHLGILGRYILTPDVFQALARTPPGKGNEIQLTDALQRLCLQRDLYAAEFEGRRYDLGNKMDWLRTNLEVAMQRPEYAAQLREAVLSAPVAPPAPVPTQQAARRRFGRTTAQGVEVTR